MKEVKELRYANSIKRMTSFFIDYMFITFIRTLILKLCVGLFLAQHINSFAQGIASTMGGRFSFGLLNRTHLDLFVGNVVFTEILITLLAVLLVAPIYNSLLIKSRLNTTIGRRIFKIYPQDNNGNKPSVVRVFCHYFASLIPVVVAISFISIGLLKYHDLIDLQYSKFTAAIVLLFIVSWYDLIFVTEKRTMLHDVICGMVFVSEGKEREGKNIFFLNTLIKKQVQKVRENFEEAKVKTKSRSEAVKKVVKTTSQAKTKTGKTTTKSKPKAKKSTAKKSATKTKKSSK